MGITQQAFFEEGNLNFFLNRTLSLKKEAIEIIQGVTIIESNFERQLLALAGQSQS
jgi:hypothetical protein